MDGYGALEAAQDSAYWAAAAAMAAWLIGLITLLVNGGGILLLWRQLKISEAAVKAATTATEIAILEQRPWLKVEPMEGGHIYFRLGDNSSVMVHIRVEIENVGRTPAVMVDYRFRAVVAGDDPSEALNDLKAKPAVAETTIFPDDTLVIPMTSGALTNLREGDFVAVDVVCLVRYRSYASPDWHMTPLLLAIEPAPEPGVDEAAAPLEVQAGQRAIVAYSKRFGSFHPT